VTDTTDPDWWQGKCMGRIGYFPSKYVTKLHPGEKPLQVTHNLQVTDGADNGLKLLRDQVKGTKLSWIFFNLARVKAKLLFPQGVYLIYRVN
jgi:hypothetical protein